jgi:hypothetical protein
VFQEYPTEGTLHDLTHLWDLMLQGATQFWYAASHAWVGYELRHNVGDMPFDREADAADFAKDANDIFRRLAASCADRGG